MRAVHAIDYLGLPEPELVDYARAGDRQAFRAIMMRTSRLMVPGRELSAATLTSGCQYPNWE